MKHIFKSTAIAACLVAGMGLTGNALAFGPEIGHHAMMGHHERGDPAKMQARAAKHLAELKTQLKLGTSQEAAWTTFFNTMQSAASQRGMSRDEGKKMRDEMQKLTSPERIDRMKAMHTAHQAQLDQVGEAVKTFYAALTPEQRKVFDAHSMPRRGSFGHHN